MSGTERSQRRARNTSLDEPGPLQDETCDHDGQLPQDPPALFTNPCEQPATFAVPNPSGFAQCVALCPWHLARFVDAFSEKANRLRERFDLDQHLPDECWLSHEDLPPSTQVVDQDDRWPLFAFDQRGHAYYVDAVDDPSAVAVYAPSQWELYDEWYNGPAGASPRDVVDVVFLAALCKEGVREDVGSGRFELRMKQFVGFGVDSSVQPVALIVQLDYGIVDRDVIREFSAVWLIVGLVHPVVNGRSDTVNTEQSENRDSI
jgi:hypothetical protein